MVIPKWVWWAIGVIAVLLIAIYLFVTLFLSGILSDTVEDEIVKALKHNGTELYDVSVNELKISTGFGAIDLGQLTIRPLPEAAQYDPLDLPAQMFDMDLLHIRLSTWGLIDLAMGKREIEVDQLSIDSLALVYFQNPESADTLSESKKGKLDALKFKEFSLGHFALDYRTWGDEDTLDAIASVNQGALETGVELRFKPDGKMKIETSDFNFQLTALNYKPRGELYSFLLNGLQMFDGNLLASGFRCDPRYDKKEFQKHLKRQMDRIVAKVDTVKLSGLDLNALLNGEALHTKTVAISGADVESFRDRSVPFDHSRRPSMPIRLLRELPLDVWVSALTLNGVNITYLELPEESQIPGRVSFSNLAAIAQNISNIPDSLTRDSMLVLDAKARIYDGAQMSARFLYNLQDIHGGFSIEAELAPMDFTQINPAVTALTNMEILAGRHQSSRVVFSGNDISATGTLHMLYSGLKVEMEPDRSKLRRAITNWTSRQLVYHSDNPNNGSERTGRIEFTRATDRFIFNYWWKCYFSGIKDITLRDGASEVL